MTAEEGKFAQKDVDWVEKETAVKKVTVYTKVTNEMLEDMDALISEIRTELLEDMRLVIDEQLLSGDGEDATNLSGILDVDGADNLKHAVGWTNILGDTHYVAEAQEYDVLKVGVTQVMKERFYPTYIILNPVDAAKMELIKDKNGQYVLPPFVTTGGVKVSGINVVENTGMELGKFLIGDFRRAKAFFQRQLTFNIYDQNENDALHDRRTMTATARLAFRIKDIHKKAFVYGDFAAAIAALTAPEEGGV
jgi:HK97 family phage major capsid protein